jgi:hypothetical protein
VNPLALIRPAGQVAHHSAAIATLIQPCLSDGDISSGVPTFTAGKKHDHLFSVAAGARIDLEAAQIESPVSSLRPLGCIVRSASARKLA